MKPMISLAGRCLDAYARQVPEVNDERIEAIRDEGSKEL